MSRSLASFLRYIALVSASALLGAILKVVGAVPTVGDQVSRLRGKPSRSDRLLLSKYVQRLDERRVFFQAYNAEVIEACVGSLEQVKEFTDEARATVQHEGAKAALGAILDACRAFIDEWIGIHTSRFNAWERGGFDGLDGPIRGRDRTMADFFQDLGELRGSVRILVMLLHQIDPSLSAPNLLKDAED